ncbi:MAG TPA: isoprenylcysteine carboxylmethyltransferase family protein [Candidatus Kapabacteria bacterium]|nr:isoprenylcysteine carboxylmethyltransferase family protein [Candidatus Kapabacteria bacterium]
MNTTFFVALVLIFIVERLLELRSAKRNTRRLLEQGGREFGAQHYSWIVAMHVMFFASLIVEFQLKNRPLSPFWIVPFCILLFAQALRFWSRAALNGRWTSRVIVVPGERLVSNGPYRFLSHPIYLAVVLELFSLPLIFNLYITCVVFTIANAVVLFAIRIPEERRALTLSQISEIGNE